jgi:hypothetical protein
MRSPKSFRNDVHSDAEALHVLPPVLDVSVNRLLGDDLKPKALVLHVRRQLYAAERIGLPNLIQRSGHQETQPSRIGQRLPKGWQSSLGHSVWATPLDPDRPGRKTVARAHLEDDGRVLVHRHFAIDDKGNERMVIEWRMTRK